jgi:hypothetical protein
MCPEQVVYTFGSLGGPHHGRRSKQMSSPSPRTRTPQKARKTSKIKSATTQRQIGMVTAAVCVVSHHPARARATPGSLPRTTRAPRSGRTRQTRTPTPVSRLPWSHRQPNPVVRYLACESSRGLTLDFGTRTNIPASSRGRSRSCWVVTDHGDSGPHLPGCACRDFRVLVGRVVWLTVIEGLAPYGVGFGD